MLPPLQSMTLSPPPVPLMDTALPAVESSVLPFPSHTPGMIWVSGYGVQGLPRCIQSFRSLCRGGSP